MGLSALLDAIVRPAGISVDILYLDRSEGEEVNTISLDKEDSNNSSGFPTPPSIQILYRPYVLGQAGVEAPEANIMQWTLRSNIQA